jgi:4-carboxymuconolactone decarboxylase
MRIGNFTAGLVVGCCTLLGTAAAQAPAANAEAPTLAALQRAVDTLPPGRVERPASYDSMSPEQQRYLESVLAGPRSAVSGPLVVMLASPTLGDLAQRTMAYARFADTEGFSSVPVKLNELAILMAARAWSSPYVWEAHDRYAVRVGLPPALVDAVRMGTAPPVDLEPDVKAVYTFLDEFLRTKEVSDATFEAARTALGGDRALVDLIGTLAIYQMSAMLTAVDRTGLTDGEQPTLRPLE